MMNECFKKQCPQGFAFHQKFLIQTDSSGSFSYSVVGDTSGIRHNSTAFIGCDKGVGRCSTAKPHIYDGIVVVPDNATINKIPAAPGILTFRKDNQKLYLRSRKSWNVIAEEKKLNQLNAAVANLTDHLVALNQILGIKEACIQTHAASCTHYYKCGMRQDGVYTINPDGLGSFRVYCDMNTDRGGWTVFQRRQDGSKDFYLKWSDYKAGFGDHYGEFWLGLDKIRRLSKSGQNVLRVDLMDFNGAERHAKYGTFSVADESDKYRLNIGSYSGDAGDSLAYHNQMQFTTKDSDNDARSYENCATRFKGEKDRDENSSKPVLRKGRALAGTS
ncbi:ryncolin-1-like [Dendronephthya gigantea]|uniref:ryncolin-1-like n=1 Tax=Dendronephthya gigantea TaxID=151771 RepID=UPI00106CBF71|nr:ryncolin-1-like [Dendronephthya gigantea]